VLSGMIRGSRGAVCLTVHAALRLPAENGWKARELSPPEHTHARSQSVPAKTALPFRLDAMRKPEVVASARGNTLAA
jgi:hypothetical protein